MTHRATLSKYLTNPFSTLKSNTSIFSKKEISDTNNFSQPSAIFQKLSYEQKVELLNILQEWAILQIHQIQK